MNAYCIVSEVFYLASPAVFCLFADADLSTQQSLHERDNRNINVGPCVGLQGWASLNTQVKAALHENDK